MSDELVYDGWLKVYKRTINSKTYEVLKDRDAVAAIILNECGEILLVKQFRPAVTEETLELPAGTIDRDGEAAIDCIVRELKEETQLVINHRIPRQVISYKPMMGFSNSRMKIYLVKVQKEELKQGGINDEDVYETVWVSVEELGQRIEKGGILDVKVIVAYWYLKANWKYL